MGGASGVALPCQQGARAPGCSAPPSIQTRRVLWPGLLGTALPAMDRRAGRTLLFLCVCHLRCDSLRRLNQKVTCFSIH